MTCGMAGCKGEHEPQDHNAALHQRMMSDNGSYAMGYDLGVDDERARIVAWMRSMRYYAPAFHLADLIERGEHSSDRQANESAGGGDGDLGYNPCCGGDSKACMVNGPCSIERARREAPRSATCRDCGHDVREHYSGGMPHCNRCACLAYVGGEEGT